jgi:hypothetical protein
MNYSFEGSQKCQEIFFKKLLTFSFTVLKEYIKDFNNRLWEVGKYPKGKIAPSIEQALLYIR